jgi:hypothetical protein
MAAEVAPAFVTLAAPAAPPSKLPAYILWGAGGISLAVGAIVGVKALAAKRDFDDKPSFSLADRAEERAMVADIAFGLGIALAVTGTFFFFDAEDTEDEDESGTTAQAARTRGPRGPIVHVAPVIGPRVGGAAASLQF